MKRKPTNYFAIQNYRAPWNALVGGHDENTAIQTKLDLGNKFTNDDSIWWWVSVKVPSKVKARALTT